MAVDGGSVEGKHQAAGGPFVGCRCHRKQRQLDGVDFPA